MFLEPHLSFGSFLIIGAVESISTSCNHPAPVTISSRRGRSSTHLRGDAMLSRPILLGTLWVASVCASHTLASTGDIGSIVETFVVRKFPDAKSHY